MIKARSGDIMVFGLSEANLQELRKGRPIEVDLRDLAMPGGKVIIFYGKTEVDMMKELEDGGLLLMDGAPGTGKPI